MSDASCANRLAARLASPFLVLALEPAAGRDDLERQGAKLLAMLAAGLPEAARYQTPLGPQERDEAAVRAALAELRDPARRALHEQWWAALQGQGDDPADAPSPPAEAGG